MIILDQNKVYIISFIMTICLIIAKSLYTQNCELKIKNRSLLEELAINVTINSLAALLKQKSSLNSIIESIISTGRILLEVDGILILSLKDGQYQEISNVYGNKEIYNSLTRYFNYSVLNNFYDSTHSLNVLNYNLQDDTYLSIVVQYQKSLDREIFILSYFIIDHEVSEDNIAEYCQELLISLMHLIMLAFDQEDRKLIEKIMQEKQGSDRKNIELADRLLQELKYKELQNDFISMASHEFRTPLSVIGSSIYLIQRYARNLYDGAIQNNDKQSNESYGQILEKVNTMAAKIQAYTNHLSSMINSTLNIAIMDERGIKNTATTVNLREVVTLIIEKIKDLRSDVDIIFNDMCENTDIIFDQGNLEHIITNLLSNALKYSKPDSNVLIILQPKGSNIIMSIQDYGIGIPKKQRKRLFEKFFRGSNTIGINGIGVGLYLTKKLIDINNASIKVVSKENVGSTFYVTFKVQGKK